MALTSTVLKMEHGRSFALVLAGGGARGLAHVGVLRALEHYGFFPSAIVGVSMGAMVGTAYGLNHDWYRALLDMDTRSFPQPFNAFNSSLRERVRATLAKERFVQDMLLGWGLGSRAQSRGKQILVDITLGQQLEDARLPVAAVASDLLTGERVVMRRGNAADAAYASGALAGILPPHPTDDGQLLADGAYTDIAPVDVARELGVEVVIGVNLDQTRETPTPIHNGLQALMRALEICHYQHANLRFAEADLVLRPTFPFAIDTLDFGQKRVCAAAGAQAVRRALPDLRKVLQPKALELLSTQKSSAL